jgi:streptomycin 6-kinase
VSGFSRTVTAVTVEERLANSARQWRVSIEETRTTETSLLGFGTRADHAVVLKVSRKDNGEEWRCGEVLEAFGGVGMIRPLEYTVGAVLLPRLRPGHDLTSLCAEGRDREATDIIASLIRCMPNVRFDGGGVGSVELLAPDFARFRERGDGLIPMDFVDRAETLFTELCMTQRDVRLLHGDLHHFNVLFDADAGWTVIDPWGAIGEIEFEVGAALRNPLDMPALVGDPGVMERRLRTYEEILNLNADRALKWAFATTVLGILWPFETGTGQDVRATFALAARSMHELIT